MATKKLLNITIFVLLFNLCDDGSDRIDDYLDVGIIYNKEKEYLL